MYKTKIKFTVKNRLFLLQTLKLPALTLKRIDTESRPKINRTLNEKM